MYTCSVEKSRKKCRAGGNYRFRADLSLATCCSTSVMMLPGPMAFTLMLYGARESAMHLHRI